MTSSSRSQAVLFTQMLAALSVRGWQTHHTRRDLLLDRFSHWLRTLPSRRGGWLHRCDRYLLKGGVRKELMFLNSRSFGLTCWHVLEIQFSCLFKCQLYPAMRCCGSFRWNGRERRERKRTFQICLIYNEKIKK
jgi:hypothetical protein